jgi:hypothetical protein
MCVCYELKTRGIPSTVSIGGNFPLHPTNIAQIYQQNFTGGIFTSENFPNRNRPNSYKPQQQNFFGISGGVSTSGNFPNRNPPYSYKPQQPNYSRISGGVSTDGVFTGGNFPNWNPPCSYKPQQQFSSEISGGVSTSGTFPYGYPINSAQPRQQIPNGVAYTVQQQEQIPSIGSTTGTLPHVFGTYPIIGRENFPPVTWSNYRHPVISAQRHENIFKGVVNPTKREEEIPASMFPRWSFH